MLVTPDNFLYWVKQLVTGSNKPDASGASAADGGFHTDFRFGLSDVVPAGSTITVTTDGSGIPILNAAASTTTVGIFSYLIPRSYDQNSDKLQLRVVANMSGGTDTPTLTLAVSTLFPSGTLNNTPAMLPVALTAGSTVVGSTATAWVQGSTTVSSTLSSTISVFEFPVDGLGLIRDNLVTFKLTAGAHTTNALQIYAIQLVTDDVVVAFQDAFTTSGKELGYDIFGRIYR